VQQLVRSCIFEQEPAGTRPERPVHVLVEVERRQHEHAGLRERRVCANQSRGLEPVEHGHADVHEHHMREDSPGEVHCFAAVAGLARNLHLLLARYQRGETGTNGGLVIGDEDANHGARR
jgi:hypothetical protein